MASQNDLRSQRGRNWHYILPLAWGDRSRRGSLEPEATEQRPLRLVGLNDTADSQLPTGVEWQDYVCALNASELLQEGSRA